MSGDGFDCHDVGRCCWPVVGRGQGGGSTSRSTGALSPMQHRMLGPGTSTGSSRQSLVLCDSWGLSCCIWPQIRDRLRDETARGRQAGEESLGQVLVIEILRFNFKGRF